MQVQQFSVWPFAALVFGFPVVWLAVMYWVSRISGWSSFVRRYPANAQPSGQTYNWSSGRFAWYSTYNRCLIITVSAAGLHINAHYFFRFGHQPIFIPWADVIRMQRAHYVLNSRTTLELPGGWPQTVTLYGRRLADAIAKTAPAHLTT